jgi:hypothetical protein
MTRASISAGEQQHLVAGVAALALVILGAVAATTIRLRIRGVIDCRAFRARGKHSKASVLTLGLLQESRARQNEALREGAVTMNGPDVVTLPLL